MPNHAQTWVKVNAPVDKGVCGLIPLALNAIHPGEHLAEELEALDMSVG